MPAKRLSFILNASNLFLTWEFWTAIGITWLDGADDRLGPWLTEEHDPLDRKNLPRVTGEIGGVDFMFYRRPGTPPGAWPEHTSIMIRYDELGCAASAIEKLKAADLFVPDPEFHPDFNVAVFDPDGRLLYLVDPNPFHL